MVRPRARAPTCPLATPLSFCPVSRFAPLSPTVHTSLLLSDDVCRRCNLACDRLFTLVVKFLHAPCWRPCTLAPGGICTPLPPLRYASELARRWSPIPYLCFWPWRALQIFQKLAVAKLANKRLLAYQGPIILK